MRLCQPLKYEYVSWMGQAGVGLVGVAAMNKKSWLGACVMVLWGSVAWGEEFTSGDWTWSIDDATAFYAGTQNSAGQMLAQFCDTTDDTCVYVVGFDTHCDEGDSYPALVNSDAGTASLEFLCGGELDDGTHLMIAKDFEQLDRMIRKAKKIGFALPMQGDEFKAVRFSLKGSVAAMDAMRKFAANGAARNPDIRKAKDSETF